MRFFCAALNRRNLFLFVTGLFLSSSFRQVCLLVDAEDSVQPIPECTTAKRIQALPFSEFGVVNDAPLSPVQHTGRFCLFSTPNYFYWYSFTSDRRAMVSAVLSNWQQSNGAVLYVLSSPTCQEQDFTCVGSDPHGRPKDYSWEAKPSTTYYILVSVAANATFDFSVDLLYLEEDNLIPNTECLTATDLSNRLPYTGEGSYFGSFAELTDACNVAGGQIGDPERIGVWYSIFNPFDRALVAKKNKHVNGNEQLIVYVASETGDCGNLACQSGLTKRDEHQYYWKGTAGTTNYIYVSGPIGPLSLNKYFFRTTSGDLDLDNGSCQTAFDVTFQLPYRGTSSYMGAFVNFTNSDCGINSFPGVWYKVINIGEDVETYVAAVQNQDVFNRFEHIGVFTGSSCNDLECQTMLESYTYSESRTLTWRALPGETSYIFVWFETFDSLTPSFDIAIESHLLEEGNDRCETALELSDRLPYSTTTSSYLGGRASSFFDRDCGLSTTFSLTQYMTSWYQVTVDRATNVTTSFANLNPVDRVAVFRGTSCDQLICLVTSNNRGQDGDLRWEVAAGETTFIVVNGMLDLDAPNSYQLVVDVEDDGGDIGLEVTAFPTTTTPSPVTSPPTTPIQGVIATAEDLSQELFDISVMTANELDHFESSVAGQTDDYWAGRRGEEDVPVQNVESTVTVTNRDELMVDNNGESVTVIYDQTIVYQTSDPDADVVGTIVSEPFETADAQAEFVIRLRLGGGNLSNVTATSEVRVPSDGSLDDEPSLAPSMEPSPSTSVPPSQLPSSSGSPDCFRRFGKMTLSVASAVIISVYQTLS